MSITLTNPIFHFDYDSECSHEPIRFKKQETGQKPFDTDFGQPEARHRHQVDLRRESRQGIRRPAKAAKLIVEALTKTERCVGRTLPARLAIGKDAAAFAFENTVLQLRRQELYVWGDLVSTSDFADKEKVVDVPATRATAPASGTAVDADEQKQLSYESAATLMAHGPHVLHEHIASKLETALGRALSQMEVRFSNLSLDMGSKSGTVEAV